MWLLKYQLASKNTNKWINRKKCSFSVPSTQNTIFQNKCPMRVNEHLVQKSYTSVINRFGKFGINRNKFMMSTGFFIMKDPTNLNCLLQTVSELLVRILV